MRFGPVRLLLLLTLLLSGGLAWMWFDENAKMRNLAWVAPKALPPDIKALASPPPAGPTAGSTAPFAVILERPLFAPDRRPPPPPAPPPPPDPLANIRIHGIFSGANAGILARVDGKLRRIKINETIGPWTLKSIDGRDITFGQGEENRQLRLAYARLDTPAPQAPAVPAPVAPASATPGQAPASPAAGAPPNQQDEARENIRRRNEIRAARGLPLLTQ